MKRLLKKIQREESLKPLQQPTLPGKPADIAAGPPDEVDSPHTAIIPDEGGKISPRILFQLQDGMDADQQLPASGVQISDVVISGAGCGSLLTGKCF